MSKGKAILFILLGIVLFFLFRIGYVYTKKVISPFQPQKVTTILTPPNSALTASVSAILGDVEKEGRTDNSFKKIKNPTTLLQGEEIKTDNNGSVDIKISQDISLALQKNTEVDYLNGLPDALVVRQPDGIVTYTIISTIKPFSIRSLGLLIQVSDESVFTITTDGANNAVYVKTKNGSVTVAYSDAGDTTQVKKVKTGQEIWYDYDASTLQFIR